MMRCVIWTLYQDNAPVLAAVHTTELLEAYDTHVLDWPACSPDLNIIENVLGKVFRDFYKDGKRYENKDWADAMFDFFMHLDADYFRNLYHLTPRRCLNVLQKYGVMIDY